MTTEIKTARIAAWTASIESAAKRTAPAHAWRAPAMRAIVDLAVTNDDANDWRQGVNDISHLIWGLGFADNAARATACGLSLQEYKLACAQLDAA